VIAVDAITNDDWNQVQTSTPIETNAEYLLILVGNTTVKTKLNTTTCPTGKANDHASPTVVRRYRSLSSRTTSSRARSSDTRIRLCRIEMALTS